MAKPGDVSDSQFESEVLKAEVPVLVDFWAPWCGPCRMVEPIVEELAEEYGDKVKFLKMNTDDNGNTATQYGIRAIPTLIVFKDGEPAGQVIGLRPKSDLKKVIDQALSA
jgi:thioredoxin 1